MANLQRKVSVIIPVYNEHLYLHEALDSVINQTYSNLEIIIIDDGSVDGCGEIADEYAEKDKRIRVIHQENKGLSTARNIGLSMMTGDAVAFFDSDDALAPSYVEDMMKAMLETQTDMVVCGFNVNRTERRLVPRGRVEPPINPGLYDRVSILRALVDHKVNVQVWNKLYRRELFESIRFPDGHIYEDIATAHKFFNACKAIYVLDKPLYLYRKHEGSITSCPNKEALAWSYSQFADFVEANTPNIFTSEQLKGVMAKRKNYQLRS